MKISVVHPGELGPVELTRWRRLHGHPELANPFLAPEFAVCVGRARPGARVAMLEEGPEVVGFFPYERGPFRVGRPIGAGLSDCQGLVHTPGLEWDPRELLRGAGLESGGPPPFDARDRSRFLQALDRAIQALRRTGP